MRIAASIPFMSGMITSLMIKSGLISWARSAASQGKELIEEELLMRRAAMLALLALLAVAAASAQNPTSANPSVPAGNQQNGGTNSTASSPNQDAQTPNGQPANNQVPGQ